MTLQSTLYSHNNINIAASLTYSVCHMGHHIPAAQERKSRRLSGHGGRQNRGIVHRRQQHRR
jgi:hypothetical protein